MTSNCDRDCRENKESHTDVQKTQHIQSFLSAEHHQCVMSDMFQNVLILITNSRSDLTHYVMQGFGKLKPDD